MEAATALERSPARELPSDKAIRIVEAMRASVAQRGIAGSTFDHVAREAGVSRGLLHYYFATKERLLVEVVRRECEVPGELLDQAVAGVRTGSEAGVFELRADPSDVASFLFALADGVTIRRLSEPGFDVRPLIDQAVAAARALLA
jgi:AcrR family transcriptional regulator